MANTISNINHNPAANAYNKAAQIADIKHDSFENSLRQLDNPSPTLKLYTGPTENGSFLGDTLLNGFKNLGKVFRKAEVSSSKSLTNEADLIDVITSVNEAEITLKVSQSIRDKIVAMYQDIMKMPL
jgi:flagellar hook-basal body complex protein FliE